MVKEMTILDLTLPRKCILRSWRRQDLCEGTILELSPSGKRMKIRWGADIASWYNIDDYILVEVLS